MLKKFVSDSVGLSDIGAIIHPSEFNRTDSDDYIFNEKNEKIYFLIKSKKDEYCFTNLGLIHVDGASAVSSKRTLKRYPYKTHIISNVTLETAGNIERDVEIMFTIGNTTLSIDVRKDQLDQLKDLYKSLIEISIQQGLVRQQISNGESSIESAVKAVSSTHVHSPEFDIASEVEKTNKLVFDWMNFLDTLKTEDFGHVFELYLNNQYL